MGQYPCCIYIIHGLYYYIRSITPQARGPSYPSSTLIYYSIVLYTRGSIYSEGTSYKYKIKFCYPPVLHTEHILSSFTAASYAWQIHSWPAEYEGADHKNAKQAVRSDAMRLWRICFAFDGSLMRNYHTLIQTVGSVCMHVYVCNESPMWWVCV